ncbi:MAG: hypothetical protein IH786_11150 [Proteobacteria bacterium]|nr:hypothetical protein [Pseudomonadota bacterium]
MDRGNVIHDILEQFIVQATEGGQGPGFGEPWKPEQRELMLQIAQVEFEKAEESGVTNTVDPLAGSYFVENLTNRVEREALDYIERIDAMGGIVAAIERGYPQKEIADASYKYQQQVEDGSKTIVGVNKFVQDDPRKHELLRVSDAVGHEQVEHLARVKADRDAHAAKAAPDSDPEKSSHG